MASHGFDRVAAFLGDLPDRGAVQERIGYRVFCGCQTKDLRKAGGGDLEGGCRIDDEHRRALDVVTVRQAIIA